MSERGPLRFGLRHQARRLPKSDDTGGSERRARADLKIEQVAEEGLAAAFAAGARVVALFVAAAVVR
jgi:hypothetical protein